MNSVCQKHHEELPVWINPNRSSSESGVAERMRSHEVAAGAAFGGNRPSEGSGAAGKLLWCREIRNGRATKNALVSVDAAIQQHLAK